MKLREVRDNILITLAHNEIFPEKAREGSIEGLERIGWSYRASAVQPEEKGLKSIAALIKGMEAQVPSRSKNRRKRINTGFWDEVELSGETVSKPFYGFYGRTYDIVTYDRMVFIKGDKEYTILYNTPGWSRKYHAYQKGVSELIKEMSSRKEVVEFLIEKLYDRKDSPEVKKAHEKSTGD